jgi:hypothetical protein
VQQGLQSAFEHWGLPQALRFDNGRPWANPVHRVPTALALWLVGLGVKLIFGRPRQSTDNAVVERSHGVLEQWIEPESCADYPCLVERLSYFVDIQRRQYPACEGLPRLQAYPALLQPTRVYHRAQEQQRWELQRVYAYLAQFRWTRTVDQNGRLCLLTCEYSVGRALAGQQVTCWLEPQSATWVVENERGETVKRLPLQGLDYPTIASLALHYRKG